VRAVHVRKHPEEKLRRMHELSSEGQPAGTGRARRTTASWHRRHAFPGKAKAAVLRAGSGEVPQTDMTDHCAGRSECTAA
jgi:hypothetical protein